MRWPVLLLALAAGLPRVGGSGGTPAAVAAAAAAAAANAPPAREVPTDLAWLAKRENAHKPAQLRLRRWQ